MGLFDNLNGTGKGFQLSDSLKYVDDFKTELVEDENGKVRKKTTYIGTWTELREPGGKTLAKLIGSAVLAAAIGVLLMATLLLNHASSASLLVMLPLAAALFPSLYLLMGAASLPYRQKPMRRDQYMHGFVRMQRSSVAVIIFTVVATICSFVYRIFRSDWLFLTEDGTFLVQLAFVIVCSVGVLWMLGTIEVAEKPNSAHKDE